MPTINQLKSKLDKLIDREAGLSQRNICFMERTKSGRVRLSMNGDTRTYPTRKKARKATTDDVTFISVEKHKPKGKQAKLLKLYGS